MSWYERQRSNSLNKDSGIVRGGKGFPGVSGVRKEEEEDLKTRLKSMNSAEVLTVLATPQVFEGPNVDIQREIVNKLENEIKKSLDQHKEGKEKQIESDYGLTVLGGIELASAPKDNLNELIASAKLVDLPGRGKDPICGHSLGGSSTVFDLVEKAGLKDAIVRNTLATMDKAGQLDYLHKSGLIGQEWKILIEIHYYRDRKTSQTNLHKDTLGQTLFVNLNFVNDATIPGPEYIVNPASSESYDKHVADSLPKQFVDDRRVAQQQLPVPEGFGASKIPADGVVAFVDELIHHKTPTRALRTIPAKKVVDLLKDKQQIEYTDAEEAFKNCGVDHDLAIFSTNLKVIDATNAKVWHSFLTKLAQADAEFNRTELADILDENDINTLIEGNWADPTSTDHSKYGIASVPKRGSQPVRASGANKPLLKRQMSMDLLSKEAPEPAQGRRTFFRTWVRAVPTRNNTKYSVSIKQVLNILPEIKNAYTKYADQYSWWQYDFKTFLSKQYQDDADFWMALVKKDENERLYVHELPIYVQDNFR